MSVEQELADGIRALGIDVGERARQKLVQYLALIEKWNRVYNLTAVRDTAQMVSTHLLDSLAAARHLVPGTVADVGSGAGLPGIPLALAWPQQSITLIESNHKKAAFLRQTAIELELDNTEVVCERVEAWQAPREFDIVISRAFSDLAEFVQLSGRLCAPTGVLAGMKGVYPYEELAQLSSSVRLREVVRLKVPGIEAERHLVLLERNSE